MDPINTIAAIKRLPVGTRLYLVASLRGPQAPSARIVKQVRSKNVVFVIDDLSHPRHGQDSYANLTGVKVEATTGGFALRGKYVGARTCAEYVFACNACVHPSHGARACPECGITPVCHGAESAT